MAIIMGDFGSCLEALEAHEEQKLDLGARVSAAIFNNERTLCGLRNGDVCLLIMDKDITKLESPNPSKPVTCLCWIGADKCLSGHESGPSQLWDLVEFREVEVLDIGDREPEETDKFIAMGANCRVVMGSSSGHLRLWDMGLVKQIAKVKAYPRAIEQLCALDDKCLTRAEAVIKMWDMNTLQILTTIDNEAGYIDFSQEGYCLIISGNQVKIWDFSENKGIRIYKGHQHWVASIKQIDENRCASQGENEETMRMWNAKDLSDIHQFPFQALNYEVKENLLICATMNGVSVVDINVYQVVFTFEMKCRIAFAHIFEDKCLCIPSGDTYVTILEVDQRQQMFELEGPTDPPRDVLAWGSDKIISYSFDKTVRVWDINKRRELAVLTGHTAGLCLFALTADDRCVSVDYEGYIKVWDLSNMKEISTNMKHSTFCLSIVVTSNGKAITGDDRGNIFVWDLGNYMKIGELQGHKDSVSCLLLVSDDIMISGSGDKTIRVWDITHYAVLAILEGHQKGIFNIVLASKNRCISGSADSTVKVWDLKKYVLLATLCGHSDEVWALASNGDECVSGSKDKTIIYWNLHTYLQKAKFLCSYEVNRLAFIGETQFISGNCGAEIKIWENFREIAAFNEYSGALIAITQLSEFRLATTSDYSNKVLIWDLKMLSNCLSHCNNRKILEKEARENKPLLPQYRLRIKDFKKGNRVPQTECKMLFLPYFFNALHFCAYYNHPALLSEYLEEGVPLLRGIFGSPLTLALERGTNECVDRILDHLITIAQQEDAWKSFQTINDELVTLLGCGSLKLEMFIGVLMQRPSMQVPTFIKPLVQLPHTLFSAHSNIYDLGIFTPGECGNDSVKFYASLVSWNLIAGSQESIELLTAAVDCEDRRILLGDFFRNIIKLKWNNCFPFTLCVSIAYGIMLACLIGTINVESRVCCMGYFVLNCLFLLYEIVQFIAVPSKYFTDGLNFIDIVRCTVGICWAFFRLQNYDIDKAIILIVVVLDFIRGFTYFRSFRMTRIFVYITLTVVAEMYSFLIIFAYSVFSFGIFTSVLVKETSISETWKQAYNLTMGNFDNGNYGIMEWIVFTCATVTNIVIMMNLLISILGEAYEKAQMTIMENDLHMQASLLLEYEILMMWRWKEISNMWVVSCQNAGGSDDQMEWSGRVLQIVNSLSDGLTKVKEEISRKAVSGEEKIQAVSSRILDIEKKVEDVNMKVEGVNTKVNNLGSKLDAVLDILQSRS